MKLKQYFFIFLLSISILLILSPANAFTIQKDNTNTVSYTCGVSIIDTKIISNYKSFSLMKKDLNAIDKIVIKVDGKKIDTIKKKTGWKRYKNYPKSINIETLVRGSLKNKNITISAYSKKNKLLDSKEYNVKTIKLKPIKTSKQAIKIAKEYKKGDSYFYVGKTARYSKGHWYIPMYDKKTKKFYYELNLKANGKEVSDITLED